MSESNHSTIQYLPPINPEELKELQQEAGRTLTEYEAHVFRHARTIRLATEDYYFKRKLVA